MDVVEGFASVLATIAGAVAIALVNDHIRARRQRKRILSALHSEIRSNALLAKQLVAGHETIFELLPFQRNSYRKALSSGVLLGVSDEVVLRLERVYQLIRMHNKQTTAIQTEFIPRNRGYKERLERISQDLDFLQQKFSRISR